MPDSHLRIVSSPEAESRLHVPRTADDMLKIFELNPVPLTHGHGGPPVVTKEEIHRLQVEASRELDETFEALDRLTSHPNFIAWKARKEQGE